jgi:calcineurin-like phosphoesterase family protein
MIDGFELRQGMHGSVIAFPVRPSEELRSLTGQIAGALNPVTVSLNAWDGRPEEKWFHVTIANRLDPKLAGSVYDRMTGRDSGAAAPMEPDVPETGFLGRLKRLLAQERPKARKHPVFLPPLLDETGLRITVMHGEHILAEYDLQEKRWVLSGHDHESLSWQHTLLSYRQKAGFECRDPAPVHPSSVFVISDLHLGHANIIRYCSRPFLFSDPAEMDHVLLKNWNYTVAPADRIYHLGDIRYGKGAPPFRQYRPRLHGQITFITGNLDGQDLESIHSVLVRHQGMDFLLIHDPADAPPDFSGWVIHGHHHNNNLRQYPFLDFLHQRVNVSCEVTGYIPVSLDEIVARILEGERTGRSTPVLLRYPHVP